MKKILVLTVMILFAFSASAFAETKIAVVNTQEALAQSVAGKAAQDQLTKKFDSMKADLERRKAEIEKMRDELQKQSMVMSMEAKQDKELEFKRKVRDLQDTDQAYKQKLAMERNSIFQPLLKTLGDTIREHGQKHGYTLIIEKSPSISGLIYNDEAVDITAAIVKEFNQKTK